MHCSILKPLCPTFFAMTSCNMPCFMWVSLPLQYVFLSCSCDFETGVMKLYFIWKATDYMVLVIVFNQTNDIAGESVFLLFVLLLYIPVLKMVLIGLKRLYLFCYFTIMLSWRFVLFNLMPVGKLFLLLWIVTMQKSGELQCILHIKSSANSVEISRIYR